jgi:heme A synthase
LPAIGLTETPRRRGLEASAAAHLYSSAMTCSPDARRRLFAAVAWGTLLFTVLVILGGTIVRATGAGDGCGESWPKCGDQFIPPNPTIETAIEFGHRASSLLAGLGVAAVLGLAFWLFARRHVVRGAALAAAVLLIVEALLGAALVLYGWVDADVSLGRAIVVPLHLANTFLLLGALTLTAWWGSGFPPPQRSLASAAARPLLAGIVILFLLGATGALNALADTVFPSSAPLGELAGKFGPTAPALSRLRIIHPIFAVLGSLYLVRVAQTQARAGSVGTRRAAAGVAALVLAQVGIGVVNIVLLTPLSLQVLHLMAADVLWIVYVVFVASWLADGPPAAAVPAA